MITDDLIKQAATDPLLTPGEVAAYFRVEPKTVSRWAAADKLPCVRTPGGHRRYRRSQVIALLQQKMESTDL